MTHFASAEADGNLDLIAVLDKFESVVELGVKIMGVDVEREANLLDFNDMLIFSGFLFSLCLYPITLRHCSHKP